jgi:tetratricopeptide (TPR) repeat protein
VKHKRPPSQETGKGQKAKTGPPPKAKPRVWIGLCAIAAALFAAFWAYSPALRGPFLFDDNMLPFAIADMVAAPLRLWLRGVRPALMFTYWINARLSGDDPSYYHVFNVLIHCAAAGLVFLILRRLLEWARPADSRRDLLAGFAAAVFLLHPIQTEAVAYLAGRSECLSVMLAFAAFAIFLYRRKTETSWGVVLTILMLFGAALLAKEQTVALPALLILTDYWWNPGFSFRGLWRNWRLYGAMAAGGAAGLAMFWGPIFHSRTAGFGLKDFTWYQYFFTQCRALFVYAGEFLLPARLTADWDFPISKTILDHGAIAGLLVLVALAAAAWHFRRRFPLASYGFFAYLILMAPTSSVLPIQDPVAERRIYFSMIGLLLIALDPLSRVKVNPKALAAIGAAVVLAAACATYARAAVWGDPMLLWQDTVRKSPNKARGHEQLAFQYYLQGSYDLALPEFEAAARLEPPTQMLLLNWALAYDNLKQPERALEKLREAAKLPPPAYNSPAHVYTQIAVVYAHQAQWDLALDALATAEKLDAGSPEIYLYRGKVYLATGRPAEAIPQYERVLAIDASYDEARRELAQARASLAAKR